MLPQYLHAASEQSSTFYRLETRRSLYETSTSVLPRAVTSSHRLAPLEVLRPYPQFLNTPGGLFRQPPAMDISVSANQLLQEFEALRGKCLPHNPAALCGLSGKSLCVGENPDIFRLSPKVQL